MRRYLAVSWPWALAVVAACAAYAAFAAFARAADPPYAGTWKVTLLDRNQEITLWLVKLEAKDGKPQATAYAALNPQFKDPKIEDLRADDKGVRMTLKGGPLDVAFAAYFPKGEAAPAQALGSAVVRGNRLLARLERTDLKELDQKSGVVAAPGFDALADAMKIQDVKERAAALKGVVEKSADKPVGHLAAGLLVQALVKSEAAADDVRKAADKALEIAAAYGPEVQLQTATQVGRDLLANDKMAALALDVARKAEKALDPSAPDTEALPVLKLVASALRKNNKADEAKDLDARVAKIETKLDEEFEKTAIPFKPDLFAGRKTKSDRVAVLELFTGAQCPPCVAADVAFDALMKTFKPAEVVFLQYHLHIPGPDPLTNADSEKRSEYYGIQGTPSVFVNGKEGPQVGGFKQHAKARYDDLFDALVKQLETEPKAKLKLTAARKGDTFDVQAEVADLKKSGDEVRLRFVVVEDVVRYLGRNGQRLHHHVVRATPGGADGFALKDSSGKQAVSVSVADLNKALTQYMTEYGKERGYIDEERPLDLKRLKVVAFVQDNSTKEILAAAQTDLPEKN